MSHPSFFGYGSLVNLATHAYPGARLGQAEGWARAWLHTKRRRFAYLSAVPEPDTVIDGVIADVPGADWQALDAREAAYTRKSLPCGTAIYAIEPSEQATPDTQHPILLSYVDVVLQGYLHQFGEAGAAHFAQTTRGWHAPILNDRAAPIYPRAQRLAREETEMVDDLLGTLGCRIISD